jgi:hypothetical protein
MRFNPSRALLPFLGLCLCAEAPAPALQWSGVLGASWAASDRQTRDGGLFLRGMDAGEGQMALDILQLGAQVALGQGWTFKATLLAGHGAQVLNGASQDTGSIAFPEATLVWTGSRDTLRFGRMYTPMGMEVMDPSQDIAGSRGLLFSYALPFAQVGLEWRHAFTPSWSATLWLFNGEDRVRDNNRGKTAGLGVGYNHGGSPDKFVNLMAFSGAEQDGLGASACTGAEGRKRERLSMNGQWVWGASTLQWEAEAAREPFPLSAFQESAGDPGIRKASWQGLGIIFRQGFGDRWAGFLRAETLKDDHGVRLGADPSLSAWAFTRDASGLRAGSLALGAERKWGATFARAEVRQDRVNLDAKEGPAGKESPFRQAASVSVSLGTRF